MRCVCLSLFLGLFPALALLPAAAPAATAKTICSAITRAADETDLSPVFLARVLHHDAGLTTPEAIAPTAQTLAAFQADYGNPGLAALALAGGHAVAETFLAGDGIPLAARDFVILTTGLTPEAWRDAAPEAPGFRLSGPPDFAQSCAELVTGSWGSPLPALTAQALPPVLSEPVRIAASHRSLRPKLRPKPKIAKWGAQLAFGKSRPAARANFDRATQGCRRAVGRRADISFVANRVKGRPGYWMARVSRMDRAGAEDICRAARARGCSCAVYKNY